MGLRETLYRTGTDNAIMRLNEEGDSLYGISEFLKKRNINMSPDDVGHRIKSNNLMGKSVPTRVDVNKRIKALREADQALRGGVGDIAD